MRPPRARSRSRRDEDGLVSARGHADPASVARLHLQPAAVLHNERQKVPVGVRARADARHAGREAGRDIRREIMEDAHHRDDVAALAQRAERVAVEPERRRERRRQPQRERARVRVQREHPLSRGRVERRRPRVRAGQCVGRRHRVVPRISVAEAFLELQVGRQARLAAHRDVAALKSAARYRVAFARRQREERRRRAQRRVGVEAGWPRASRQPSDPAARGRARGWRRS